MLFALAHRRDAREGVRDDGERCADPRDDRDERDIRRGDERGWGGAARGWGSGRDEETERDWARQWGYVEGRGRGGREPEWSRGRDWGLQRWQCRDARPLPSAPEVGLPQRSHAPA